MYNTPLTLDYEIMDKKFLCIICTDFLEFIVGKSNFGKFSSVCSD